MVTTLNGNDYQELDSQHLYMLSLARKSIQDMPKINPLLRGFFRDLREKDGMTVPDFLTYPLSLRFQKIDGLSDVLQNHKPSCVDRICGIAAFLGLGGTIVGPVMMYQGTGVVFFSGMGALVGGLSCLGGVCCSLGRVQEWQDRPVKDDIALEKEKIVEVFLEAQRFSQEQQNGLRLYLEERVVELQQESLETNTLEERMESGRLKELNEIALKSIKAMIDHFNLLNQIPEIVYPQSICVDAESVQLTSDSYNLLMSREGGWNAV